MSLGTHVRLCLKDLYPQDVVEMIERETRKYEVEAIEDPSHPDYKTAFQILWEGFGAAGEMEPEPVIREMMLEDPMVPLPSGSYARFFLLVARDRATGTIRGVRDGGCGNPPIADLCASTFPIFLLPEAAARWPPTGSASRPSTRGDLPPHPAPHWQDRLAAPDAGAIRHARRRPPRWITSARRKALVQRVMFIGSWLRRHDPRPFATAPDFLDPSVIAETGTASTVMRCCAAWFGRGC